MPYTACHDGHSAIWGHGYLARRRRKLITKIVRFNAFRFLPLGYLKLYAIFLTSTLNQVLYYIAIYIFHLLKTRLSILVYLLFSHNTSIFLLILYTKFKIITENKPFVVLFNWSRIKIDLLETKEEYDYEIIHRSSKTHMNANTLSRCKYHFFFQQKKKTTRSNIWGTEQWNKRMTTKNDIFSRSITTHPLEDIKNWKKL